MIGGFGLWELLIIAATTAIIIIVFLIPIWLTFRFKRTKPNNLIIGSVLGLFTPFAQFYPTDKWGWWSFLGVLIIDILLGYTGSLMGVILYFFVSLGSIIYRIKTIKRQETPLKNPTD